MHRTDFRPRARCLAAVTALAILALTTACPEPAAADWPSDPTVNLPVCIQPNMQQSQEMVTDRAGGAIIAWTDMRDGVSFDIYAQRVLASGLVDPGWPANGRAICTAIGNQGNLRLVEDGAGGAILIWTDARNGPALDLYAHHLLPSGAVDPAWPTNGLAVCTADSTQYQIRPVSDGAGGALVCWTDRRSLTNNDIYAAHILGNGTMDPAWPVSGLAVCTAIGDQTDWAMVRGAGNAAIVVWNDNRSGSYDIYAQRVLPTGTVDPSWPVDGAPVSAYPGNQQIPDAASDGAGGVFVAWLDYRSGATADIYSAHMLAAGVLDLTWPPNGQPLCTAGGDQLQVRMIATAPGEAIVAWMDQRTGPYDIYAQRVAGPTGSWPSDGQALCTAGGEQRNPSLASDGSGGVLVSWHDSRNGGALDIFAHHLLASGDVDGVWPINGRALSTAARTQQEPRIVADGSGGGIVSWFDFRIGLGTSDIFAQRVQANGQLGGTVVDVPAQTGLEFVLESIHPNPSRGGPLTVRFSLGTSERVTVELVDLAGRRMSAQDMGLLGPGRHAIELAPAGRIPAGLYFVRVLAGSSSRSHSAVILE
jgi:hypothetical protein